MISVVIGGDPNWADVAMLAVQTAGLIAAGLAYLQLKAQVRLQRDEMHSSLRPLIVVQRARLETLEDGVYVQVRVQNVGPGPAAGIEVRGWPRVIANARNPDEGRSEMDAARKSVELRVR